MRQANAISSPLYWSRMPPTSSISLEIQTVRCVAKMTVPLDDELPFLDVDEMKNPHPRILSTNWDPRKSAQDGVYPEGVIPFPQPFPKVGHQLRLFIISPNFQ